MMMTMTHFDGLVAVLSDARAEVTRRLGASRQASNPWIVDHDDQRHAEIDPSRVAVDRRQYAHQRQHQPARRKLCAINRTFKAAPEGGGGNGAGEGYLTAFGCCGKWEQRVGCNVRLTRLAKLPIRQRRQGIRALPQRRLMARAKSGLVSTTR